MRLIPLDCSQEEAVVQLAHSLSAFQLTADQIFKKAALRTEKCRRRMELLGKRMETLERKMEVMEKLNAVPLLNCASNFPELCSPAGVYEPVFGHSAPFTRANNSHFTENKPRRSFNSSIWLNEAICRRRDLLAHLARDRQQQREKVVLDVHGLEKLSAPAESGSAAHLEADFDQRILTRLLFSRRGGKATTAKPTKSTQIDFSESLIDLCPPKSSGHLPMPFEVGMIDREDGDPFAYEPAELEELADFDLPDDFPGIDAKSVSFVSKPSTERRSDRLTMGDDGTATESAKAQPTKGEDEEGRMPVPSATTAQTVDTLVVNVHAPLPPPPPPPPPSLQQKESAVLPSTSASDRSDLMAAIRAIGGASGAKLKKVEEDDDAHGGRDGREQAEGAAKAKTGRKEPAEDLMSSLAKALEKRRKGMLGKGTVAVAKPKKSSGGDETLAMLRERVPRIRAESEEEEVEDERSEWID